MILGASYGSLLATKLLFGGHAVKLVCRREGARIINSQGTRVRLPVKGREAPVEIDSRSLPGTLSADAPADIDPAGYDLVALAMQEPQYSAGPVRQLLEKVARAGVPCLSIMNMPPLAYLKRIPNLDAEALRDAYTDATVWDGFDPHLMTLCSPDPQAFRPPEEALNVLQVTLPTNFKAARFEAGEHTQMLRALQSDIEAARFDPGDGEIELPVKLKVHESIFVPLAKWAMLIAGNYRCVTPSGARAISEAVHADVEESRCVYNWVCDLCIQLGASPDDMVPFEKYARAAEVLVRPSSAARALYGGAPNIERVDRLVQAIGRQFGTSNDALDETVALIDAQLSSNRQAA